MEKVKVNNDVFVEATGTLYKAGTEHEVSDALAKRHGDNGTKYMKVIKVVAEKPVKK